MGDHKINISSTAVEKAIDLARDFLGKLITPAVEEAGLLLAQNVTFWKVKNQVNILNKAKAYCIKHEVPLKAISLKVLCPLLDYSALEDDEVMQDKWATLLANMVDSRQNIENHVFPYILSQISKPEFLFLKKVWELKSQRQTVLSEELETVRGEKATRRTNLGEEIKALRNKIELELDVDKQRMLTMNMQWLEIELNGFRQKEEKLLRKIQEPQDAPVEEIKLFELANLVRLGLLKETIEPYAESQSLHIPNFDGYADMTKVDFDIDMGANTWHELTELGDLFISACSERRTDSSAEV